MTLTRNGVATASSSRVSVFYFFARNSRYYLLGTSSASEYAVVVLDAVAIPLAVKVGDNGTAYTTNRFSSPAKTTFLGTETVTYEVLPDTATTALLQVTRTQRDTADVVTSQVVSTLLLAPSAAYMELEKTLIDPVNNISLTLTF